MERRLDHGWVTITQLPSTVCGGHSRLKAVAWGPIPLLARVVEWGVVERGGVLQGGVHQGGGSWVGMEEVPRDGQETPV